MLAHYQIAAHVEQDVAEARFRAQIPEAPAVQLALAVERRDQNGVGVALDGGVDELAGGRERTQRHHLEAGLLQGAAEDAVADDVGVGSDHAGHQSSFARFRHRFLRWSSR